MSALAVLARFRVEVLEEVLDRSDDRLADALHHPRVPDRERRRGNPPDDDDDHRRREKPEPDPAVVVSPREDVVEVDQQPRGEHEESRGSR